MELSRAFVDFSRKVFVLGSKLHERNTAREELLRHIREMKRPKKKKLEIVQDFERFEAKIADLIEKEKRLASSHVISNEELAELKNKTTMLEHQLWKEMDEKARILEDKRKRIAEFEHQLDNEKKAKQELIEKNKRQIEELGKSLNSVRENLNSIIKRKKRKGR